MLQPEWPHRRHPFGASVAGTGSMPSSWRTCANFIGSARRRSRIIARLFAVEKASTLAGDTAVERRARRQLIPSDCPVTVMKPKLRTEALMARASR